jgi:hypothetical protein
MNLYLEFILFCSFLLSMDCIYRIKILKGEFDNESN